MFTLKLYRRVNGTSVITRILPCHHVETSSFKYKAGPGMEVRAFDGPEPCYYQSFVIGDYHAHVKEGEKNLRQEEDWWGWGLLENEAGRTTEHFRPASYG